MSLAVPVVTILTFPILCIFTFYNASHPNCSADNTITHSNSSTSLSKKWFSLNWVSRNSYLLNNFPQNNYAEFDKNLTYGLAADRMSQTNERMGFGLTKALFLRRTLSRNIK